MGNNTPKKNRISEVTAEQKLVSGFNKHESAIPSIVINGEVQSAQQINTTLQSRIDAANAVLTTKATWQAAVVTDKTVRDTTATYIAGVRKGVLVAFSGQTDVLADFGLTARIKPVATPEELLARTAKAKATRAARHTLGPKQKLAIKGTVAPTAPATVTAPADTPKPAAPPVPPAASTGSSPAAPPVPPATPTGITPAS